jgi:sugar/nucleoside kinase (ribokinase family)
MTSEAPRDGLLDLLVIGGLTIDRFAGEQVAPGGSVLHATRAAAHAGLRTAIVTAAGEEPTAAAGIDELQRLAAHVEVQPAGETIRFRHRESPAGRRLWLENGGGAIDLDHDAAGRIRTRAVLFAPVASEVGPGILRRAHELWSPGTWTHGAILQGWLRRASHGREVVPLTPSELSDDLVGALARLQVLVASREDLLAADALPARQLAVLRARVGDGPVLVVTDGPEGVWMDDGASSLRHLPAPWRVEGVPMVGAGDAFAALFVAGLASKPAGFPADLDALAMRAMRDVAELLAARRSGSG